MLKTGDLVWVRYVVITSGNRILDKNQSWKLGIIVDDKRSQHGIYKVHIMEYDIIQKHFEADLAPVNVLSTTYDI